MWRISMNYSWQIVWAQMRDRVNYKSSQTLYRNMIYGHNHDRKCRRDSDKNTAQAVLRYIQYSYDSQ